MTSPLRPSPLSFNSPRSSPFRRPSSPGSPSTVVGRPSTPPSKSGLSPMTSPSKLKQTFTASEQDDHDEPARPSMARSQTEPPPPASSTPESTPFSISATTRHSHINKASSQPDNLSTLPLTLLHSLRESFSVLDASSKGTITPSSVTQSLSDLGLAPLEPLSTLFPAGQPPTITLPTYLHTLSQHLTHLSPPQELLNAFAAFDDDDSGQIDVAELRSALLHTVPEKSERTLSEQDIDGALNGFTGRRILSKYSSGIAGVRSIHESSNSKKNAGEVFRYQEFVGHLTGGSGGGGAGNGSVLTRVS